MSFGISQPAKKTTPPPRTTPKSDDSKG